MLLILFKNVFAFSSFMALLLLLIQIDGSIGFECGKVDIWDERKVFGSRGHGLKDEMLGKDPPPVSVSNGKSSNPIKIVKRDASSVRVVSIE